MASNKKKKKSQQKPQQGNTAQATPVAAKQKASQEKAAPEPKKKGLFKSKADKQAEAGKKKAASAKSAKGGKGGKKGKSEQSLFSRIKGYFKAVKTEMHRVVWPTKKELRNYSVAVIVSLIIVGVVIAVLDLVIGEGLVLFSGLRG